MSQHSDTLREWALRNGNRPGGWPAMPDPIAECPECGNGFEPSEPDTDEWCPACAGADRWDNP